LALPHAAPALPLPGNPPGNPPDEPPGNLPGNLPGKSIGAVALIKAEADQNAPRLGAITDFVMPKTRLLPALPWTGLLQLQHRLANGTIRP